MRKDQPLFTRSVMIGRRRLVTGYRCAMRLRRVEQPRRGREQPARGR